MPRSVESERPMLASEKSTLSSSHRISTYSISPSAAPSDKSQPSMATADPRAADIKEYTTSLRRLDDKRLEEQRYVVSPQKEGDLSKLALASKVERALNRRYCNQDAVMKPKKLSDKS